MKETLQGLSVLCGIFASGGVIIAILMSNVEMGFGLALLGGIPATILGWLASKIKPKKTNWVAGGSYDDWRL